MSDERLPAHFWPTAIGVTAGGIGIALFPNGWGGIAYYPMIAGGVLLIIAALIGDILDR
jgi:hypothetical protein